jgi:hypothetical protein
LKRVWAKTVIRFGKRKPASLVLIAFLSLFPSWNLVAKAPPKELPMLVSVGDLTADPDQYDGHRVVVTGSVRSLEIQRGRRGSEYIMLILEENTASASSGPSVSVVTLTLPPVRQGHHALVQGVYHREGKQAGRTFEHFIDAEVILKE